MVYLDNNATTPVHPEVYAAMEPFLRDGFGNPSAPYGLGRKAREAVEMAREQVAALIGASPSEIVFTSGGTESIATALHSALSTFPERRRIVTTAVEHSATEKPCQHLERLGFAVDRIPVDTGGRLDLDALKSALDSSPPALVSTIWANNETGVISPIDAIAATLEDGQALWHSDAVQAVGKIPVRVDEVPVHLLSISGHKLHAPKGIGALFVRRQIRFHPLLLGGGQESNRRSGTENVPGIVALGRAASLAAEHASARVQALRDRFESVLIESVEGTAVNGDPGHRLPNTSNLVFPGLDAEALLILLDEMGVACSPGSACSTGARHPSPVLTAMGYHEAHAKSSLRFSFSSMNNDADVDEAIRAVTRAAAKVREVRRPDSGWVTQRP